MSPFRYRSICVFSGSSPGHRKSYAQMAERLGRELASRGVRLVYGGGNIGLMGIVADAVLTAGGHVTGVIPHALAAREVAHLGVTDLRLVSSMHERKSIMSELSDAFIALPGGLGTLEEFCEVLTWAQLGLHQKPCGLLDVDDYYRPLREFFAQGVREGFLTEMHASLVIAASDPVELLAKFAAFEPAPVPQWIDRRET